MRKICLQVPFLDSCDDDDITRKAEATKYQPNALVHSLPGGVDNHINIKTSNETEATPKTRSPEDGPTVEDRLVDAELSLEADDVAVVSAS